MCLKQRRALCMHVYLQNTNWPSLVFTAHTLVQNWPYVNEWWMFACCGFPCFGYICNRQQRTACYVKGWLIITKSHNRTGELLWVQLKPSRYINHNKLFGLEKQEPCSYWDVFEYPLIINYILESLQTHQNYEVNAVAATVCILLFNQ